VTDLSSKRVLLLGAETEISRAIASALAEAGAHLALVGASNDSETAFAVQRLARKLNAEVSQAIDATNEMAVRVMVRQVSKALGGLDAIVRGAPSTVEFDQFQQLLRSVSLLIRFGGRELARSGGRHLIVIQPDGSQGLGISWGPGTLVQIEGPAPQWQMTAVSVGKRRAEEVATEVVATLAAPAR